MKYRVVWHTSRYSYAFRETAVWSEEESHTDYWLWDSRDAAQLYAVAELRHLARLDSNRRRFTIEEVSQP